MENKVIKFKNNANSEKVREWILKFHPGNNEPKPLFINKKLCISSGKNINIYSPVGGSLLKILSGHKYKVISLWRSETSNNERLISCDIRGNIHSWCEGDNDNGFENIFSLSEERVSVTFCEARKNYYIMAIAAAGGEPTLPSLFFIPPHSLKKKFLTANILPGKNTVALSHDGKCMAAIKLGELFVTVFNSEIERWGEKRFHNTGRYQFTCVVFHPTQHVLAVGARGGHIWVWYEIMERIPVKMKLHWHTVSPADLCFSPTGADLFSGGQESVVVRWRLKDRNKKSFLPRLGMPICYIVVDPLSSLLAIFHHDMTVSIVDVWEMKLKGLIERVTSHIPINNHAPLSAGLMYHPPTASLLKNGQTGHLQFFQPGAVKVMYNLDIALSNVLNKEREKQVANVDVTKAAVSDDGLWLVTSEACSLTKSFTEIVLKFWFFNKITATWVLNTHVQTPHTEAVNGFAFRPMLADEDEDEMCASCSEDCKVNVWRLVTFEDVKGAERNYWSGDTTLEFRGLPSTACSFSPDGSLLAVAFNAVLTLWRTDDLSLAGSLSQPFLDERICDVSFSHGELGGSSLVSRSESYLCSWDLLSCSLLWRVLLRTTCLAADPHSSLMAVFGEEKEVFFFEPRSSQPIASLSESDSATVLCSIFVPDEKTGRTNLHCFDTNQDYFSIDVNEVSGKRLGRSEGGKGPHPAGKRGHAEEGEANLFSALMAKSRNVSRPTLAEDDTRVSLVAPTINSLVKELHDLRVHSISFSGLVSHLSTFLPDISSNDEFVHERSERQLAYRTIKDDEMEASQKRRKANEVALDEDQLIKSLHKLDFGQMVHKTLHS